MNEETFARELERRADRVHGAPLSLDDVRATAHAIRRRRRATAAAAVAAVVALAIVVPSLLGGGSPRSEKPQPAPAPPGPGATAVLHDGVVTMPDGDTVPVDVDNQRVQQVGVLTDGRIVVASSRPYAVQVHAPDGRLETSYPVAANAITMSADHRLAAWVDETYRISVLESGVAEPTTLHGIPMPGESPGSIDAVLGSDCAGGGCSVLGGDYSTTTTRLTVDSVRDLVTPEPFRVTDVSPDGGTWAVDLPPAAGEQFGCVGLYDVASAEVTARSCATSGLRFSADGEHLVGSRGDNNMSGTVTVVDRDLRTVLTYDPARQVVSRFGWADATHLLAATADVDGSRWALLEVPIDGGEPTVVDGPAPGRSPERVAEYLLSD